jgi:hypothetical protein
MSPKYCRCPQKQHNLTRHQHLLTQPFSGHNVHSRPGTKFQVDLRLKKWAKLPKDVTTG